MAQVIWNSDIDVYNPQVIPIPIAKAITRHLPIPDLLNFSCVSKNTHKTVNDPRIWVSMLKEIGAWDESSRVDGEDTLPPKLDPLNCMTSKVLDPSIAKWRVIYIFKSLDSYYLDLLTNKSYDKLRIFQDFQSPEEQCKILNNLMLYSKLDRADQTRYDAQEKLSSLFEIFENALLRELEIHFDMEDYASMRRFVQILMELNNHQTLIDFFIQKSIFDNRDSLFEILEYIDSNKFFTEEIADDNIATNQLNVPAFENLMNAIVKIFNYEATIIDSIFPNSVPMMYKVSEELILNQLAERFNALIDASKSKKLYLAIVPFLYNIIRTKFVAKLGNSENLGEGYHTIIQELVDMQFEQIVSDYIREELLAFKGDSNQKISEWKKTIEKREEETSQNILRNVRSETKNDFLSSFKKAFTVGLASSSADSDETDKETYSEIQAKEKILTENMKSINKIFSLKLTMEILNDGKNSLVRILHFENFSIASLKSTVMSSIQEIFISVMEIIGNDHLKPGFEKALTYLRTYNPSEELKFSEPIKPLILFSDLVNVADLIIQMVEIFYKEELIHRNIVQNENSILNPSLQRKKKLEQMVDNYVADGLNIGIDVLIKEIDTALSAVLVNKDYCPSEINKNLEGPTKSAMQVVQVLDGNFDLLVGCAEKSVVDVFQQELAERFFQAIVKTIKRSTISNTGAVTLIADLNMYYDCILNHIKSNKRLILPLFQSLKKVGSIYLISGDDSKAIGKLVSNLSKFNGIFGQEEIYEFVQRREDWQAIKKDVEKIMYGLNIGDCTIV